MTKPKSFLILTCALAFCSIDLQAQDTAGVHIGGYSPAFQMLMQEQSRAGVENCTAPKHSAPKCVNPTGPYSRKKWSESPPECGAKGGERGEIRAVESTTGKACMIDGYCFCGGET